MYKRLKNGREQHLPINAFGERDELNQLATLQVAQCGFKLHHSNDIFELLATLTGTRSEDWVLASPQFIELLRDWVNITTEFHGGVTAKSTYSSLANNTIANPMIIEYHSPFRIGD